MFGSEIKIFYSVSLNIHQRLPCVLLELMKVKIYNIGYPKVKFKVTKFLSWGYKHT